MEDQFLIHFTLIISEILILIQIFVYDSNAYQIATVLAITQILICLINFLKNSFTTKTVYFQYIILVQQIVINSQFTFLFIIISSMMSRDLIFKNILGRITIIILLLSQVMRIAIYWQNVPFQIVVAFVQLTSSSLIFLKSQIKLSNKQNDSKLINNQTDAHHNIVQINSQTNLVISLKHLDSDFAILEAIPVGVLILGKQNCLKYLNTFAKQYFNNFTQLDGQEIVTVLKDQLAQYFFNLFRLLLNYFYQDDHSGLNENPHANKNAHSSIRIEDPIETILSNYNDDQFYLINKYKEQNKAQKQKAVKIQLYQQYYKSEQLVFVLFQDISSKSKKKELTQFIRFQNNIINSFSHELRTPLNSSLQILEVLSIKLDSELNRDYILPAINSNKLLLFQINDILDYAAIQSNQFCYNFRKFNIQEIFEQIKSLFNSTCSNKGIRLNCKANLGNQTLVNDRQRIMQVLINLINNSIKFSPQNTNIRVQFKSKCKFNNFCIKVKVKDQGFGISDQRLNFLLKELRTVSSDDSSYWATSTQLSAGIGLKISNRLIKGLANNDCFPNTFLIKTEFKKFTQISFFISDFSIKNTTELDSVTNVMNEESASIWIQKSIHFKLIENINQIQCDCARILIVDDVPFNIQALKLLLLQHKIKCDQAFNGVEAVELVINKYQQKQCHPIYDIIIMDIEMPIMNGIIAAQKILQFFNSLKLNPPAIVVSSAYDQHKKDDLSIFAECLPKPVDSQHLISILGKYLNDLK